MNFRFLIQPAMAIFFAIRAGIRDGKKDQVPYLWRFATSKGSRMEISREAWKDIGKVFFIATVLDVVYQLVVIFGVKTKAAFYPLESLVVAFLLSVVPYILFRGPVSRLMRLFVKKKDHVDS